MVALKASTKYKMPVSRLENIWGHSGHDNFPWKAHRPDIVPLTLCPKQLKSL